jgi:ribonuclease D
VRALWEARDQLAQRRDVTPGRIIPDSAIVAAAQAMPEDRDSLLAVKGFHGRGAERYASRWAAALREVAAMDEAELPTRAPRSDGPPLPRAWADRDPTAARRLSLARAALGKLAEEQGLPVENVLTPDYLRRVLWTPPATRDPESLATAVDAVLSELGARPWQIELAGPVVTQAILKADQPPDPPPDQPEPQDQPPDQQSDQQPDPPPDEG